MSDNRDTKAPSLDNDLLCGADEIAGFIYGDPNKRRKVYHLGSGTKSKNRPPLFRMGNVLCARRSTLLRWIAAQEEAA